ncbi:MAG: hypothetical protein ABW104_11540 [Candidatus Thiodiazotropha sp. 6PLUC2]
MERMYYLMRKLHLMNVPFLPRLIMLLIRFLYNSFIPPETSIGKNVSFGHKLGIVLHRKAVIGDRVRIRHQVTMGSGGAKIGNDVDVGCGAKLIGNIVVGDRVKIGANAVVVKDVPSDVVVVGIPAKIVRTDKPNTHSRNLDSES